MLQPVEQKLQRYNLFSQLWSSFRVILVKLELAIASLLQQGNRSSSSACGSADVLEALGVVIDLEPEVSSSKLEQG